MTLTCNWFRRLPFPLQFPERSAIHQADPPWSRSPQPEQRTAPDRHVRARAAVSPRSAPSNAPTLHPTTRTAPTRARSVRRWTGAAATRAASGSVPRTHTTRSRELISRGCASRASWPRLRQGHLQARSWSNAGAAWRATRLPRGSRTTARRARRRPRRARRARTGCWLRRPRGRTRRLRRRRRQRRASRGRSRRRPSPVGPRTPRAGAGGARPLASTAQYAPSSCSPALLTLTRRAAPRAPPARPTTRCLFACRARQRMRAQPRGCVCSPPR